VSDALPRVLTMVPNIAAGQQLRLQLHTLTQQAPFASTDSGSMTVPALSINRCASGGRTRASIRFGPAKRRMLIAGQISVKQLFAVFNTLSSPIAFKI
jgi:hypothetical protein